MIKVDLPNDFYHWVNPISNISQNAELKKEVTIIVYHLQTMPLLLL